MRDLIGISVLKESWFKILASRKSEICHQTASNGPSRLIAVFGGAAHERGASEWKAAFGIGRELALQGATVFNGGYGGVMESSAEGAKSVGGISVGVTCRNLLKGGVNPAITHEWEVSRWDQRLFALVFLADGYIAMPGTSGTLLELSLVIETQLKGFIPARPVACFGSHWKPVVKRITGADKFVFFSKSPGEIAKVVVQK